jgi:hypothetical protein
MKSDQKKSYKNSSRMQGKSNTPLLLPLAVILLVGIGCYFLLSSQKPTDPAKSNPANPIQPNRVNSTAKGTLPSRTDSIAKVEQQTQSGQTDEQASASPSSTPQAEPTYIDMTHKLPANPEDFPDDLRNQLNSPPPELPPEMKAQLEGPQPEIPDDIQRALSIPPRPVTPEEVNSVFSPQ